MVRKVLMAAWSAILCACGTGERQAPSVRLGDVEFETPPNSGEPNLAVMPDGGLVLTWFEPSEDGHALRFAVRSPGGWSDPGTVVSGREFFVNWADFPSLAVLDDGTWVAHWLEKTAPSPYAYHVRLSRSGDGGATWDDPVTAHRDLSPTEHGFVAMIPLPGGDGGLVWLDGRNTGGEGEARGAMQVRSTTLRRIAEGRDEFLVDDRACDCCQTAMVRSGDGLVAAYRDRSEEEIRDIAVSRFTGEGWTDPVHVGDDRWHFPACPVNGPSLAAAGDTVVVTWFTAARDTAKVLAAFSTDAGAAFGAPIRLDVGSPLGRVDVELLPDGSALAVWLERDGEGGRILARTVHPSGALGAEWTVSETSPTRRSGFPRMARAGDEVLFAWTMVGDAGGVRVAAARLGEE